MQMIPALRILDYEKNKPFYVDGLGFEIQWEHRFEPGFPVFVEVKRDEISLFLTEHIGDCEPGGLVYLFVCERRRCLAPEN